MESKFQGELSGFPEEIPVAQTLSELKDMVYYCSENLKLIESCDNLKLPPSIKARNSKLKKYCELRRKSYELICKSIEEGTDKYQRELDECYSKIVAIIAELRDVLEIT